MRSASMHSSVTAPLLTKVSPNNHLSSNNSNINSKTNSNGNKDIREQNKEEEVIYFWYKPKEVEI